MYQEIFDTWNQQDIILHRKLTDSMKRFIDVLKKDFDKDEIIQGIKNYATILKSPRTFFKHKWTLEEFLQRQNGCRAFIYKKEEDYLSDKTNRARVISL